MKEQGNRRFWLGFVILLFCATPAFASDLILVTGEKLIGVVILERGTERFVVQHPILGQLTIPTSDIRTIDDRPIDTILIPTEMTPNIPAIDTSKPEEQPSDESSKHKNAVPAKAPFVHWTSQLEFGGNVTDGPTETGNIVVRFRTTKTKPDNITRVDMNYRLSTSNNNRTVNRFDAGLFSEWNREDTEWNTFSQGRYEHAEFESWDHRLTGSGGIGYRFLNVKELNEDGNQVDFLNVIGRLGGGLRQEFGSQNEELAPEGLVGLDMDMRLSDDQRLLGITRYYPDLSESGQFRIESAIDWTIDIDKLKGVSLKLGLQHEYNSQKDVGISKNDVSAQATLVIKF